ncbi:MAG: hypothetical protein AAFQ65_04550 [Myxococcota bacterium]
MVMRLPGWAGSFPWQLVYRFSTANLLRDISSRPSILCDDVTTCGYLGNSVIKRQSLTGI